MTAAPKALPPSRHAARRSPLDPVFRTPLAVRARRTPFPVPLYRILTFSFVRTVIVDPAGKTLSVPPTPIDITVPAAAPRSPPVRILLNSPPLITAPSRTPAAAPVTAPRTVDDVVAGVCCFSRTTFEMLAVTGKVRPRI